MVGGLKLTDTMIRFWFWVCFSKMCSPSRAGKEFPQIMKIQKCLDLIDCTRVLPISICTFDSKDTPDAFKHVPTWFKRPRDRKYGLGTRGCKLMCIASMCILWSFTQDLSWCKACVAWGGALAPGDTISADDTSIFTHLWTHWYAMQFINYVLISYLWFSDYWLLEPQISMGLRGPMGSKPPSARRAAGGRRLVAGGGGIPTLQINLVCYLRIRCHFINKMKHNGFERLHLSLCIYTYI